jgi:hypothetical protein
MIGGVRILISISTLDLGYFNLRDLNLGYLNFEDPNLNADPGHPSYPKSEHLNLNTHDCH